jgi:hypothetical protein
MEVVCHDYDQQKTVDISQATKVPFCRRGSIINAM